MVGVVVELLDVTGVPFRSVIAGQDEAGGGKRILGANKLSPAGTHYESVTLVDHDSRMPVVSRGYYEEGGEQAALRPLDGRDPNHLPARRDVAGGQPAAFAWLSAKCGLRPAVALSAPPLMAPIRELCTGSP